MNIMLKKKKQSLGLKYKANTRTKQKDAYWLEKYGELSCIAILVTIFITTILTH